MPLTITGAHWRPGRGTGLRAEVVHTDDARVAPAASLALPSAISSTSNTRFVASKSVSELSLKVFSITAGSDATWPSQKAYLRLDGILWDTPGKPERGSTTKSK